MDWYKLFRFYGNEPLSAMCVAIFSRLLFNLLFFEIFAVCLYFPRLSHLLFHAQNIAES
jgi:hypothetical protein